VVCFPRIIGSGGFAADVADGCGLSDDACKPLILAAVLFGVGFYLLSTVCDALFYLCLVLWAA
jgi:hypothetical protein